VNEIENEIMRNSKFEQTRITFQDVMVDDNNDEISFTDDNVQNSSHHHDNKVQNIQLTRTSSNKQNEDEDENDQLNLL